MSHDIVIYIVGIASWLAGWFCMRHNVRVKVAAAWNDGYDCGYENGANNATAHQNNVSAHWKG